MDPRFCAVSMSPASSSEAKPQRALPRPPRPARRRLFFTMGPQAAPNPARWRALAAALAVAAAGAGAAGCGGAPSPGNASPQGANEPDEIRVTHEKIDAKVWLAPDAARATVAGAGPLKVLGADIASEGDRIGAFVEVP